MNSSRLSTRRDFLKQGTLAAIGSMALPSIVSPAVLGRAGQVAPNDRIVMGCIGVGPQGQGVMGNFLTLPEARIIAACDVRQLHAERARDRINEQYKNRDCVIYHDFRELLARKDVDVVSIATPDHWHVPVAVAAAKAGKDMYLEKPMGLSLAEDQLLRQTIHKHKRVFQFGTQQRSGEQFWRACQLVRNGRIGTLKQVNVWSAASQPGGSTAPAPVPEGLDYEFWLGPAPAKPYTDKKCDWDGKTWWFNYDYALGFVAGWGVHPLDIANWGTSTFQKGLVEVEGSAVIPTDGACNTSVAWDVTFRSAEGVSMRYKGTANGHPACAMNDLSPWAKKYGKIVDHGTAFEGTDGWILVDRTQIRAYPESMLEEKTVPGATPLIRSGHHQRNLLESVRSRRPAVCGIDEAVQADILCHLSDIATRVGRKLTWDAAKEKFVGDKDANRRLAMRSMRAPWKF